MKVNPNVLMTLTVGRGGLVSLRTDRLIHKPKIPHLKELGFRWSSLHLCWEMKVETQEAAQALLDAAAGLGVVVDEATEQQLQGAGFQWSGPVLTQGRIDGGVEIGWMLREARSESDGPAQVR